MFVDGGLVVPMRSLLVSSRVLCHRFMSIEPRVNQGRKLYLECAVFEEIRVVSTGQGEGYYAKSVYLKQ